MPFLKTAAALQPIPTQETLSHVRLSTKYAPHTPFNTQRIHPHAYAKECSNPVKPSRLFYTDRSFRPSQRFKCSTALLPSRVTPFPSLSHCHSPSQPQIHDRQPQPQESGGFQKLHRPHFRTVRRSSLRAVLSRSSPSVDLAWERRVGRPSCCSWARQGASPLPPWLADPNREYCRS